MYTCIFLSVPSVNKVFIIIIIIRSDFLSDIYWLISSTSLPNKIDILFSHEANLF